MQFRITGTFRDGLAKFTGDGQKTVKFKKELNDHFFRNYYYGEEGEDAGAVGDGPKQKLEEELNDDK